MSTLTATSTINCYDENHSHLLHTLLINFVSSYRSGDATVDTKTKKMATPNGLQSAKGACNHYINYGTNLSIIKNKIYQYSYHSTLLCIFCRT